MQPSWKINKNKTTFFFLPIKATNETIAYENKTVELMSLQKTRTASL